MPPKGGPSQKVITTQIPVVKVPLPFDNNSFSNEIEQK